ncbi:TPA: YopX family protein [Streptococcus suis]
MIPKFRAWDTEHGQWSEEFFVYSKGGLYTPNYGFNRKHLKNRTDVYPIVKQERLILMQSTGLFDKNGMKNCRKSITRTVLFV